jgi:hypothetical protein
MLSKEATESCLKKFAKNILKKSQIAVTVTHNCQLFTYKSWIKSYEKIHIYFIDRLKMAFFNHYDQMRHLRGHIFRFRVAST